MGNPSKIEIIRQAFKEIGPDCKTDQVIEYAAKKCNVHNMHHDRKYIGNELGKMRGAAKKPPENILTAKEPMTTADVKAMFDTGEKATIEQLLARRETVQKQIEDLLAEKSKLEDAISKRYLGLHKSLAEAGIETNITELEERHREVPL